MKTIYIVIGILGSLVLAFIAGMTITYNTAVGYEETISESRSNTFIQEKREVDVITKMAQVVQADSRFEASAQLAVVQARNSAKAGNITSAVTAINAVAEQYPDLKSNAAYTQLMTELSVSENLKAQYRVTQNDAVIDYKKFVRRFPASFFLTVINYKVVDFDYLQFEDTQLPDQLFPNP